VLTLGTAALVRAATIGADRRPVRVGGVDDGVVTTGQGTVRGRDPDQHGVRSFRGIPFAAAPQGPLRFQPPAPPSSWDGVRDCAAFGAAPPQLPPIAGVPPIWRPQAGLDCLTLNVWTPDLGAAGLPVMVWIYGGLWKHGSSSMPQYDGATLARSGVVVVTVNYRVGFEGFGQLPGVPANRGLLDQLAAMEWVRHNIAAFGGDPDTVTLFGQSAGAASTALLVAAPAAAGLMRRAIAQSIPAGVRTLAEAEQITAKLAAAAGAPATWEGFAHLPPEAILAVQDVPLTRPEDGFTAFGPVVDGELVTGPAWTAIAERAGRDVDLICGFTQEEYRGMAPGAAATDVDLQVVADAVGLPPGAGVAYREAHPGSTDADLFVTLMSDALVRMPTLWVAEAHAKAGGRTWLYDLAWRGAAIGPGHGVDVPLIFGDATSRRAARLLGSPPPRDFAALSEQLRAAWTGFAATGDPGWPGYDIGRRQTRIWGSQPLDTPCDDDPLARSRLIWATQQP
jgi:carboxylesterase type B